jgi:RimJ/RimL family protein N-acetyltransferase
MIRGACLCGGVRFEIAKAVGPFELCHCSRCRKSSGSAFAAFLGVEAADYRLLAGAELIVSYDAPILRTPPAYRSSFCRRCGSPVPNPPSGADWFEIPAGLLDGDPELRPDKHIFVEHQAPWCEISDELPRFSEAELGSWRRQHGRRPRAALPYRELTTARLCLRRPRSSDAELIFSGFGADPEVMRFLAWRPHAALADAEAAMERRLERLANGVEYSWILERPDSGAAVGLISGWLEGDALELGFTLVKSHWGRGLMTEATIAVGDWALCAGAVRRVWASCDAENLASARVLEKAGLGSHGRFERAIVRPNLGPDPRPSLYFSRER